MKNQFLCCLMLISLLLSCTTIEEQKDDSFLIGFSQCTIGDDWRKTMNEEMMREISFYRNPGIKIIIKDASDDNRKQIEDINELLSMEIDLLIVSPNEAQPLTPIVEEVFDKGIPVIVIDRKINSEKFNAYIGADSYSIGREAGKYAVKLLKGKGKILEVTGLKGSSASIERSGGFHEMIDQYPGIDVIKCEGAWLHEVAREVTDSLFSELRDIQLVYAHNDPMSYGAYLSVKKHNLHPFILGIDGLNTENGGIQMVLDKTIDCTFLYPTGGDKAIQLAMDILRGEPYEKYNYMNTLVIDPNMARTMKLQGDKLREQQDKIDSQLEYIGEIDFLIKKQNTFLILTSSVIVLLVILAGLIFFFLYQKNRINRALDNRNKMIQEQYNKIFEQRDDLIKVLKIAEEATEEKLRFFTNISHEFRSLISLISLPIKSLIENADDEKTRDKLNIVRKSAERLYKLAQEILRFRKLDANKFKLKFHKSDISAFISEIVDTFKPKALEKEVVLTADLPSNLIAEYDPSCIEKIMFNLLSNSIKHTDKGGIIYVKLELENSFIRFDIKDTGRGIPEKEIPYIFDRFYRVNNHDYHDNDESGIGIGLAFCKELLSLHGGTIRAESTVGKGTTFTIFLPQYHGQPVLEKEQITFSPKDQPLDQENNLNINKEKTVLIVEDNPDLRTIIADALGKYFSTDVAVDGIEGLMKATDNLPDLILSDILMPGMDGIQMTSELKKNPYTYHIPVILLTAIDSQESTIKGFDTGADDYITKPFNETILIKRIQNLIESRERLRRNFGKFLFSFENIQTKEQTDKEFINRCLIIIQEKASDESYNLDHLAGDLNLSRSSLYRKIKELTGMRAIDFMKKIKLQYAAKLLLNQDITINEVAWRSGFSDAKYFSKCFAKEYEKIPSKFREMVGNNQ